MSGRGAKRPRFNNVDPTDAQLKTLAHSVAKVYPLVEICHRDGRVVETLTPAAAKPNAGPEEIIDFLNDKKEKHTIAITDFNGLINFNDGYRYLHSFFDTNKIFPSFVLDVRSFGKLRYKHMVRDVKFIHHRTNFLNVYPTYGNARDSGHPEELETPPSCPAVGSTCYGFVLTGGHGGEHISNCSVAVADGEATATVYDYDSLADKVKRQCHPDITALIAQWVDIKLVNCKYEIINWPMQGAGLGESRPCMQVAWYRHMMMMFMRADVAGVDKIVHEVHYDTAALLLAVIMRNGLRIAPAKATPRYEMINYLCHPYNATTYLQKALHHNMAGTTITYDANVKWYVDLTYFVTYKLRVLLKTPISTGEFEDLGHCFLYTSPTPLDLPLNAGCVKISRGKAELYPAICSKNVHEFYNVPLFYKHNLLGAEDVDIFLWWNNKPKSQTQPFIHGGPEMTLLDTGHVAVLIVNDGNTHNNMQELLPLPAGLIPTKSTLDSVLKHQGFTFLSDKDSPSECAAVMAPFTDCASFVTELDVAVKTLSKA